MKPILKRVGFFYIQGCFESAPSLLPRQRLLLLRKLQKLCHNKEIVTLKFVQGLS